MKEVIVFEGMDKAGKGTMINAVLPRISEAGVRFVKVHEPWYYDDASKTLRDLAVNPAVPKATQIYTLIGLRLQLYLSMVIPAMDNNQVVFSDRSLLTSAVYQCDALFDPVAIINAGIDACKRFRRSFIPNVVVFLEIPHAEYLKRLEKDGVDEEIENVLKDKTTYDRIQSNYLLALRHIEMFHGTKVIRTNDADKAYTEIMAYLNKK